MSDFIQNCIKGTVSLTEVDDYIDKWHESRENIPLYEYLGMTEKEYSFFIKDENYLEVIIKAHKEKTDIEHILKEKKENYLRRKEDKR